MAKTNHSPYSQELMRSKFWLDTALKDMNRAQWEAICDGCGKCCLHKFIDDDTHSEQLVSSESPADESEIYFSNIACYLFDDAKCSCTQYASRSTLVPDCVTLTPDNIDSVYFMPPSCSYRRLAEGRGLARWHPLLNKGAKVKMHKAGISAKGKVVNERAVDLNEFEDYIVLWPLYDCD